MNKTIKKILIGVVGIGIIGGAYGYYQFNKKAKNFADSKADFTLTSKQLFDEFAKDQNACNTKYVTGDKTIELTGTIKELPESPDTAAIAIIDVQSPDGDISCTFMAADSKAVKALKVGDQIKLKGQCTGYQELISKEVLLMRCGLSK